MLLTLKAPFSSLAFAFLSRMTTCRTVLSESESEELLSASDVYNTRITHWL
jgi:hypothetical protein